MRRTTPEAPPAPAPSAAVTLHSAAQAGDLAQVEALVAGGSDINLTDVEGMTPLHLAAFGGHEAVARFLLANGANANIQDAYGFTPLHAAARDGHLAVVQVLVEHGADVALVARDGLTPREIASLMQHDAIASYLAAHGAAPPEPTPTVVETPDLPSVWLTGATFRAWTSASGAKLDAEFVRSVFDTVVLRRRDGTLVRIGISNLQAADQALARQLAGVQPPALVRARAARGEKSAGDSVGLKIGRENGWTVLEGCRLLRTSANDGDSFHVRHEGKEFIFRLYYVDAPETSMAYPDRVEDQARYFRLEPADTVRLGKEAKAFSDRVLSAAPFTVVTKWEDAMGNSRLPRYYGFVITAQGDLDELLAAEGLVRIYGMRTSSGLGSRKSSELKKLEAAARHEQAGAWGMDRGVSARP